MSILSDRDIKEALRTGKISIEGMTDDQVGPSSVDLTLGNEFRVFKHAEVTHVDPEEGIHDNLMEKVTKADGSFIIHPGEFVLGTTKEYVKLPADMVGRLDGRSSWGRLGIIIHSTAGFVNPGFEGQLTLEMANISKVPVKLRPGVRICQITFEKMSSPSENAYNKRKQSKYVGQRGPEASRLSQEE